MRPDVNYIEVNKNAVTKSVFEAGVVIPSLIDLTIEEATEILRKHGWYKTDEMVDGTLKSGWLSFSTTPPPK